MVLGSIRSGEYEQLLAHGYQLTILADNNRNVKISTPEKFKQIIHFNFSSPYEKLEELVLRIHEQSPFSSVLNLREYYVAEQALLSKKLGFLSLSDEAVQLVTNKNLMRKAFSEKIGANSTSKFADVNNEFDLKKFSREINFPIILKPTNFYGSLFVIKINHERDLIPLYQSYLDKILAFSSALSINTTSKTPIQAEEFLKGSNHSMDCLVDADGEIYCTPVVDVITGNDLQRDDFHHFARWSPSSLDLKTQEKMKIMAKKAILTLKMRNSAAHVEFICTKEGPKLLEIAARPGGHRNRILEKTYGIHFILEYVRLLQGEKPNLAITKKDGFIIVSPFPSSKKLFTRINSVALDKIQKLPTYAQHHIKVIEGEMIGPAREGFLSNMVIELNSQNITHLHDDMKNIAFLGDIYE